MHLQKHCSFVPDVELQATSKLRLWRPRLGVCILDDLGVVTEPLSEPQNLKGRWALKQNEDLRKARLLRDPVTWPLILPKGPQGKLTQALAGRNPRKLWLSHCLPKVT